MPDGGGPVGSGRGSGTPATRPPFVHAEAKRLVDFAAGHARRIQTGSGAPTLPAAAVPDELRRPDMALENARAFIARLRSFYEDEGERLRGAAACTTRSQAGPEAAAGRQPVPQVPQGTDLLATAHAAGAAGASGSV